MMRVLPRRLANRAANLAVRAEAKRCANPQRARNGIFEIDSVRHRIDLLEAKSRRRERAELRSPIGLELVAAAIETRAIAGAFQFGIVGREVEERDEVALPTGIHPIHDYSHLIEIAHAKNPVCRAKNLGAGLGSPS